MSKKKKNPLTSSQKDSKKELKKTKLKKFGRGVFDVFMWMLGAAMYSTAVVCFIRPLQFSSGGVTGIALIINYLIPVLPIGALVFMINVPLFIASWKAFGIKFILNTLAATALLSAEMDTLTLLAEKYGWLYTGDEKIIGAIFGGILAGAGLGIVFLHGATTGGTDILARLLRLKFPHISVGKLVLLSDFAVVLATGIVYKNVESILYSLVIIFLSSQAIDYVVSGRSHSKMLMISTSEPEKVTEDIIKLCGRGVSLIHAEGGYTREEKKMLLCVVRAHEVNNVRRVIAKYDEKPFIIVTDSSEVLGQGFKSHNDTL